ncbi:sugar-binding protein [Paenibacillus sp. GCM10023252]|uniref:sugar-binding protein n=1 Tax=Paenibacillus sp. GCM10023252 TaxID=3252649 RepID=UPI00360ED9E6
MRQQARKRPVQLRRVLSIVLALLLCMPILQGTGGISIQAAAATTGTEYYMSPTGSDSNDGSEASPWATVAHFDSIAQPGDTLYIREGTYEQSTDITAKGTASAWITIRNYPGETVIFDGSDYWNTGSTAKTRFAAFFGNAGSGYIVIQGLIIQNYRMSGITVGYREKDANGIYIGEPATHYNIRYNMIDRCGQNGISSGSGASDMTYEYNLVGRTGYDMAFGSWSSGLNMIEMEGMDNYVRGNISYHNIDVSARHTDGNGMILDTSAPTAGAVVENNLFFHNGGVGIAWTDASNATIRNNTLYENGLEPDYVNGPTGMAFWEAHENINITNNIVYQRNKNGLKTNIPFDANSVVEANNISGQTGAHNPQFTDPANADFTLKSDSPDVDRGFSDKGPIDTISFDHKALKREIAGQPVDWYSFAPDFDYIKAQGGLENIIKPATRTADNGRVDLGAFTSAFTNPNPDAVIPDEVLPPEPPKAVELLTNQGFETGLNGWTELASTLKSVNSIQACQSGYQCMEVSGRTAFWHGVLQSITPKVKNDRIYDVSGHVKLPAGAAATNKELAIYVKIVMDSDPLVNGVKEGNTYTIGHVKPTADAWQSIAGTIATPATGVIEEFQLLVQGFPDWANDPDAYNDSNTFLVDNLSIKEQLGGVKQVKQALNGTPASIDGVADSAWDSQNKALVPAAAASADAAAGYKVLWNADHLYVLASVKDATADSRDKIELYVNGDYDKKSDYSGANDRKISVTRAGVVSGGAGAVAAVKEGTGGYVVEVKVPFATGMWAKGDVAGFDVKVTDNDTVKAWNNQDLLQDSDKQTLGKLELGEFTGELAYIPHGTPNLDVTQGMDSLWSKGAELKTEILTGTSSKQGNFRVLWDETYLYVLAHVTGDKALNKDNTNVYEHDSVEIFKDENNAKTTTYQNDDGQFRINYENEQSVNSKKAEELTSFAKVDGTNYWVASKIKWTNAHAAGDVLGFDLQVNDTNGTPARTGTLNWSDATGQGWQNTSGYGLIVLNAPVVDSGTGGGGSGGTGGGIGGIGGGSGTVPYGVVDGTTVKVTAKVTDGIAAVTVDSQLAKEWLANAVKDKSKEITVQVVGVDGAASVKVELDAAWLQEAEKAGVGTVIVKAGLASFKISISGVADALPAGAKTVSISVSKVDATAGLSEELAEQVAGALVYEFELLVDGKPAGEASFEGKGVEVRVPYVLKAGEKANQVVAAYLDEKSGQVQIVKHAKYDKKTQEVVIYAKHFSKYAVYAGDAGSFTDLGGVKWAEESVLALAARGIVNGVSEERFAPEKSVTRAQFVQLLIGALDLDGGAGAGTEASANAGAGAGVSTSASASASASASVSASASASASASSAFTDVVEGAWYYDAVAQAEQLGIVSGYPDGSFGVNKSISREEMAVMVTKALKAAGLSVPVGTGDEEAVAFVDEADISEYALDSVLALSEAGIVTGHSDGRFGPSGKASRAQAAVIIARLLEL